jgi:hypothetical protein
VALATLKAVHEDDEGLLQDIDGTVWLFCVFGDSNS